MIFLFRGVGFPRPIPNMKGDITMGTKNIIINNFAGSLTNMSSAVMNTASMLNDNMDENTATIATINVLLDSVRSQTVLLQNALDNYMKG